MKCVGADQSGNLPLTNEYSRDSRYDSVPTDLARSSIRRTALLSAVPRRQRSSSIAHAFADDCGLLTIFWERVGASTVRRVARRDILPDLLASPAPTPIIKGVGILIQIV